MVLVWVKIAKGIGSTGKLWTGSDIQPALGRYARAELVEFHSPKSGACTRRLFLRDMQEHAPEGIKIPTLHIFTGGVGSLVGGRVVREHYGNPTTPEQEDAWLMPLLVWNWSGRVGGYLILDPVSTESGYVRRDEVNSALPGYAWIQVYAGDTLSEFVLVRTCQKEMEDDTSEKPDILSVDRRHCLPIHRTVTSLVSPPERPKREEPVSQDEEVEPGDPSRWT